MTAEMRSDKLKDLNAELLFALKGLYEDHMDFIRLNKFSGAENNHWMIIARVAIAKAETR